jgi:hypothetical protein
MRSDKAELPATRSRTIAAREPTLPQPRRATIRGEELSKNAHAVRVVERWGLLAGVTGTVANVLLIALYALAVPGLESYEWTGPANDVIGGIVSTGALIPVAFALRDVVGDGTLMRRMTIAGVLAMTMIVVVSLLLVVKAIPFAIQGPVAGAAAVILFLWVGVVGRVDVPPKTRSRACWRVGRWR